MRSASKNTQSKGPPGRRRSRSPNLLENDLFAEAGTLQYSPEPAVPCRGRARWSVTAEPLGSFGARTQPDRAVTVRSPDFQNAFTAAAENKDLNQFRGVPLEIQHPSSTICFLGIVRLAKCFDSLAER